MKDAPFFFENYILNELFKDCIENRKLNLQEIKKVQEEVNKKDPVIIDIHLKGNTARRQASTRMGHYMKQGYQIKQL